MPIAILCWSLHICMKQNCYLLHSTLGYQYKYIHPDGDIRYISLETMLCILRYLIHGSGIIHFAAFKNQVVI